MKEIKILFNNQISNFYNILNGISGYKIYATAYLNEASKNIPVFHFSNKMDGDIIYMNKILTCFNIHSVRLVRIREIKINILYFKN